MKYIFSFLILCASTVFLFSQQVDSSQTKLLLEILEEESQYYESRDTLRRTQWALDTDFLSADKIKLQEWVSRLEHIQTKQLSFNDKITYDFLVLVLTDRFDMLNMKAYLMPLNSEGGFLTSMFYSSQYLILYDQERKENYYQKLEHTISYLQSQQALLKQGLDQNIVVPKLVAKNTLSILKNQLLVSDSLHFLIKPIFRTNDPVFINKCLELFNKQIRPAFESLGNFLRDTYIPKTRNEKGISNNSDGRTFYEQRVRYYTTLDMTPQEVFDTGMSEVARIKSEMEQIIADLKFDGSFKDFFEFLRTDEQFYPKTGKQLLQEAAWLSKKAEAFLPEYFEHLPRMPFTVKPVPDDIAPTYTAGRYSGGSYKQNRPGAYWVNTYNLPSRALYLLPALTLHEAVPGHHLQGSLAQEMKEVPSIRSKTYLSAFGEGWALYCEYLGNEAGYYQTPYEHFGRLSYEMWRACRLVVDPGLHYFDWTREQALDFMSSHTALSLHEVNTEIDRYIGWPGQAVSYKIGELKIRALRKKAETALAGKFNIRKFHRVLLENGSVPLSTLENIVDQYINSHE